jgi:hypothetical protein
MIAASAVAALGLCASIARAHAVMQSTQSAQSAPAPAAPTSPASPTTPAHDIAVRMIAADWVAADMLRLVAGPRVEVVLVDALSKDAQPVATPAPVLSPDTPTDAAALARAEAALAAAIDPSWRDTFKGVHGAVATSSGPTFRDTAIALRLRPDAVVALDESLRPQLRVPRDATKPNNPTSPAQRAAQVEPLYWHDPGLWARGVTVARRAVDAALRAHLAASHPDAASDAIIAEVATRAREARDRLVALNDQISAQYTRLAQGTTVVVAAPGLAQLARVTRLDIRVVPSAWDQPDDAHAMDALVSRMVERRVGVVFAVDAVDNPGIAEVIRRCADKGLKVRVGGTLHLHTPLPRDRAGSADGAQQPLEAGAVERVLRHNAKVIVGALVPEGLPRAE